MNFLRNVIFITTFLFLYSLAQAGDLTQEQWIDYMTKNLPIVFCNPNQYYRECFEFTQEECRENITFAIENCIDKNLDQMPEMFTIKSSRKWGSILEKCVDEEYVNTYSDQRIDNEYCRSIR